MSTEWMTKSDWLTAFRLFVDFVLLATLAIGIYWGRRIARKLRITMDSTNKMLAELTAERELVGGLLKTVKGWVVVHVGSVASEVQKAVPAVAEATADLVIDKIKSHETNTDSGKMPVYKPPEGWKPGDPERRHEVK